MSHRESINFTNEGRALLRAMISAENSISLEPAMTAVARRIGLSKWGVWNLYHGRRKSLSASTLAAIRSAYLSMCERQLQRIEAEMAVVKGRCGDVDVEDLASALCALAEEVRKAKQQIRAV